MSILRWLGLVLDAGVLGVAFARFRGARSRRLDFALASLFGAGLVCVSVYPDSVGAPVRGLLVDGCSGPHHGADGTGSPRRNPRPLVRRLRAGGGPHD